MRCPIFLSLTSFYLLNTYFFFVPVICFTHLHYLSDICVCDHSIRFFLWARFFQKLSFTEFGGAIIVYRRTNSVKKPSILSFSNVYLWSVLVSAGHYRKQKAKVGSIKKIIIIIMITLESLCCRSATKHFAFSLCNKVLFGYFSLNYSPPSTLYSQHSLSSPNMF